MATTLQMQPIPLPLTLGKDDVVRVSGTDTCHAGYGCKSLLQSRAEVDAYLEKRRKHAQGVRRENQKRFDQTGIRERLLVRNNK